MSNLLNQRDKLLNGLIELPRYPKRLLLIANDLVLLILALWLAFSLRLSTFYVPETLEFGLILAVAPLSGVLIFYYLGLYRLVTRFIGQQGAFRIFLAVLLSVLVWSLVVTLAAVPGLLPRSVFILYGLLAIILIWGSRYVAGSLLQGLPFVTLARFDDTRTNVLIYGAAHSGVQLLNALRNSDEYSPVAFIDDDKSLQGQNVSGLKVYPPNKIEKLVERGEIKDVFLAMSEATLAQRKLALRRLEPLPVLVKTLPALSDIAAGKVSVSDLRHVDAEDLLGRDPIPPNRDLLGRNIFGKVVMITGAGGSIGSELARQILLLAPRKIVLFDLSEIALYDIEMEIRDRLNELMSDPAPAMEFSAPQISVVLGSVHDRALVMRTMKAHDIETVYHAAAYKHVPLVEANQISGLTNNTFGTRTLALCAQECGVDRFVLISTDKAVRPTNIMGASKRLAELVLQALSEGGKSKTVFTMVRFGNVLDSSGSVIKRFKKQILDGGPVTVTHPEIIRYFMSIPEAAQLVIQAGAMGSGGDVFVLDMGEPVKIDDLARSMIRLMGRDILDEDNQNGDIAIEYMGLRPGEKLYEELLIGDNSSGTKHPRILRNLEPKLSKAELDEHLKLLELAMSEGDKDGVKKILCDTVEGYVPEYIPVGEIDEPDNRWVGSPRTLH